MVDFRSRSELDQANRKLDAEQADYKRMYQEVLAENQAFRAKLDEITASHGQLQAQFADLLDQFQALKIATNQRGDDLLTTARNMEDMVTTAYTQQGEMLECFRSDIAGRLGTAKASLGDLDRSD